MDDLIMFLVFILIAVVNLVKTLVEKNAKNKRPPAEPPQGLPQKGVPKPFQDFFDTLAEAFDAKPKPVIPEWPNGYERPDYMQEMEDYEASMEQTRLKEMELKQMADEPVREFADAPAMVPLQAVQEETAIRHRAPVLAMPSGHSAMKGMRMPAFPVMRSATAGKLDIVLENKADLKRAIIANIVFGPPRAYDTGFENTVVK